MLGGQRKSEVAIESGATRGGRGSPATRAGAATALPGPEHLDRRMRELLHDGGCSALRSAASRPIVVVRHLPCADEVINERRLTLLGAVLSSVFDHGETLARLWGSTAAVLADCSGLRPASTELEDLVSALWVELRWAGLAGAPAHARIERHALPVDAADLARLWRELRAPA